MNKILVRKFAFIILLVSMSAPSMATPFGDCPEGTGLVDISQLMNSGGQPAAGFSYALLAQDANGDGYACALFRCALCPPKAQRCNLVCTWSGPLSDNDQ
jgi:hypothetical protein